MVCAVLVEVERMVEKGLYRWCSASMYDYGCMLWLASCFILCIYWIPGVQALSGDELWSGKH